MTQHRYPSVDELRFALADAWDRRPLATSVDLGAWVRRRLGQARPGETGAQ